MDASELQMVVEAKLKTAGVQGYVRRTASGLDIQVTRGPVLSVPYGATEARVDEAVDQAARARRSPAPAASVARPIISKARKFDNLYNEGAEGFNPYRNR